MPPVLVGGRVPRTTNCVSDAGTGMGGLADVAESRNRPMLCCRPAWSSRNSSAVPGGQDKRLRQFEDGDVAHAFRRVNAPAGLRLAVNRRLHRPAAEAGLREVGARARDPHGLAAGGHGELREREVAVDGATGAFVRQAVVGQRLQPDRGDGARWRGGLDDVAVLRRILAACQQRTVRLVSSASRRRRTGTRSAPASVHVTASPVRGLVRVSRR